MSKQTVKTNYEIDCKAVLEYLSLDARVFRLVEEIAVDLDEVHDCVPDVAVKGHKIYWDYDLESGWVEVVFDTKTNEMKGKCFG